MASPGTLAAVALLVGGLAFTAVAVVGLYRLPDCYSRAHATSKSETLGALLALAAAGVAFGGPTTTVKLGALALFLLVTSPTAAHAIVRSADDQGIEPWRPAADRGLEGDAARRDAGSPSRPAGEGDGS